MTWLRLGGAACAQVRFTARHYRSDAAEEYVWRRLIR